MSEEAQVKPVLVKTILRWASLSRPSPVSGAYQVDLTQLSPAAVAALEEKLGVTANHSDENGFYVTCKSKFEIYAFDEDGERITVPVGNGSEAKVLVGYYPWKFKNKTGRSAQVQKLVVTKLVEYKPDNAFDGEEEAL